MMIFETERLYLRELTDDDFPALCRMLQDPEVMYAYGHAFSEGEVREWLARQQRNYLQDGFGLWAMILQESGELIGQCGITMQDCAGAEVMEISCLLRKDYWHQGYATEAALGCRQYAFEVLNALEVYALIGEDNLPAQQVAKRLGMEEGGSFLKHYGGEDLPQLIFYVANENSPLADF